MLPFLSSRSTQTTDYVKSLFGYSKESQTPLLPENKYMTSCTNLFSMKWPTSSVDSTDFQIGFPTHLLTVCSLVKVDEIETALNVYIPAQAEMPPPEWSLKTQMLSGCVQQLMTERLSQNMQNTRCSCDFSIITI